MEIPKQKKGNFIQYEMKNGIAIQVGGSGNKDVNFSTALLKVDKGKDYATFKQHSHPGNEIIGVIYGEIKIPELNRILTKGEFVHIPINPKTKVGIDHTVNVFTESQIWLVTFNPPDTDFPTDADSYGFNLSNRIISIALSFIGV